jgi:hypothetical protein
MTRIRASFLATLTMLAFSLSCTASGGHSSSPSTSVVGADAALDLPPGSYIDPTYGWTVTPPASLRLRAFGTPATDRYVTTGVSVSNFPTVAIPQGEGLRSLREFPDTGVMFMFWHNEGGLAAGNRENDTPLPLDPAKFNKVRPYVGGAEPEPRFKSVIEGGGWFAAAVWIGPEASTADRQDVQATVRSMTFRPLDAFSISEPGRALVLDRSVNYAVGSVTAFTRSTLEAANPGLDDSEGTLVNSGFYLVHGTNGFYAVPMTAQSQVAEPCRVSVNTSTYVFSCPIGATWDRELHARKWPASDDAVHGFWLYGIPATISWDGKVLVSVGTNSQAAAAAWS